MTTTRFLPRREERGMAILLVAFVLVMVLVGGLVAVAVTSGEISSAGGYRVRAQTETCAKAAADRVAQLLPDMNAVKLATGTIGNLTYRVGHLAATTKPAVRQLENNASGSQTYDAAALAGAFGEMTTNGLGSNMGTGMGVYAVTVVCSGASMTPREVEIIVRFGLPTSF